jgi:D-arabinose 1-dehydrogenase-like Zn-dependent alcohol dehydrogenase
VKEKGMNEVARCYTAAEGQPPELMWAWPLYGAGLDNLGQNHRPVRLPVPLAGPYELLARIDAVGLCFSDVKLIRAGGDHPRLYGRDLAADPTIPGHEVSLTIVDVGEELGDRFRVGQRFVVQADIYYRGVNLAYGYMLRGGLSQYSLLGEEILNGDAGCYLIPINAEVGYAESALTEPWACIEASYRIQYRPSLRDGGVALFVGPGEGPEYSLSSEVRPQTVLVCEVQESFEALLRHRWETAGTVFVPLEEQEVAIASWRETEGNGLDDIVVLGPVGPDRMQELAGCLAPGGVLNLVLTELASGGIARGNPSVGLDVGRIHYDDIKIVGCAGPDIAEGYRINTRAELKPGGRAWFLGAGGPMGQMQVQRALEMPDGPRTVLASNLRSGRIGSLGQRFSRYARRRGIDFACVTRNEVGEETYFAELGRLAGEGGFDDIVVLAPSHRAVEEAARYLAEGGVMNMFAGLARGTLGQVNLVGLLGRRARIIGSSGSSIEDLEYTLRKVERGDLRPNGSIAAVAGIEGVWDGMQAVAEGRFPGKIVVYPQIEGMELTPLDEIRRVLPEVADRMEEGVWTRDAEGELLRR